MNSSGVSESPQEDISLDFYLCKDLTSTYQFNSIVFIAFVMKFIILSDILYIFKHSYPEIRTANIR